MISFLDITALVGSVSKMAKTVHQLLISDLERSRPRPRSNAADREANRTVFKSALLKRYMRDGKFRCMVTDVEVHKKDLIAAHIVGLDQKDIFTKIGLAPEDLWHERNGILVLPALEDAYSTIEVV